MLNPKEEPCNPPMPDSKQSDHWVWIHRPWSGSTSAAPTNRSTCHMPTAPMGIPALLLSIAAWWDPISCQVLPRALPHCSNIKGKSKVSVAVWSWWLAVAWALCHENGFEGVICRSMQLTDRFKWQSWKLNATDINKSLGGDVILAKQKCTKRKSLLLKFTLSWHLLQLNLCALSLVTAG